MWFALFALRRKASFNLYDGFEPSGRMHIAQGLFKAVNAPWLWDEAKNRYETNAPNSRISRIFLLELRSHYNSCCHSSWTFLPCFLSCSMSRRDIVFGSVGLRWTNAPKLEEFSNFMWLTGLLWWTTRWEEIWRRSRWEKIFTFLSDSIHLSEFIISFISYSHSIFVSDAKI